MAEAQPIVQRLLLQLLRGSCMVVYEAQLRKESTCSEAAHMEALIDFGMARRVEKNVLAMRHLPSTPLMPCKRSLTYSIMKAALRHHSRLHAIHFVGGVSLIHALKVCAHALNRDMCWCSDFTVR